MSLVKVANQLEVIPSLCEFTHQGVEKRMELCGVLDPNLHSVPGDFAVRPPV